MSEPKRVSSFNSTDKFVEEYQQKLKELQYLKDFDSKEPSPSFRSEPSPAPISGEPVNHQFSLLRHDFQDSLTRLEEQFVNQFNEYKVLRRKIEDSKKELELVHKVKVSVDSYQQMLKLSREKKSRLEEEFLQQKSFLAKEIENIKSEKESMRLSKEEELQILEQRHKQFLEDYRIAFEEQQLLEYGEFRMDLLSEMQTLVEKRDQLSIENEQIIASLESKLDEKKQYYHDLIADLSRVHAEEQECVRFEQQQLLAIAEAHKGQLQEDIRKQKQESMADLIEFTEQLEQKRHFWDLEKVKISEEIEKEKYAWEKEKERLELELETKEKSSQAELKEIESKLESEYSKWNGLEEEMQQVLKKKELATQAEISRLQLRLEGLEEQIQEKQDYNESLDSTLVEKKSEYESKLLELKVSHEEKRKEQETVLEKEYADTKDHFVKNIQVMEDKQKTDFEDRLRLFEEDLSKRRRVFEEELLHRRQSIIEECKREQKIEFDHLLEFENEKFANKLTAYKKERDDLQFTVKELERQHSDLVYKQEQHIKELMEESQRLERELALVEDMTRQKERGHYEETYKQLLETYKSKAEKDFSHVKQLNSQLEGKLKQKNLEVRDSQLKIKRLESQLNQYLIADYKEKPRSHEPTQKVLRHKSSSQYKGF